MDALKTYKSSTGEALHHSIKGYIEIARIDHWFKNVFMLFGVVLAIFHNPQEVSMAQIPTLVYAFFTTCLIASSNYVLNEILDSKYDRLHPKKKYRPIPSGRVAKPIAYAEWVALAFIGFLCAYSINPVFFFAGLALWIMGLLYNAPPIRLKDIPYLDVISESVNNPIRLLLGWFVIYPNELPSISLLLAYWLIGAFFMASKRFSEYRMIDDPQIAAGYRKSFAHYSETRLLVSMFFYTTLFGFFFGIFILKYHFELILMTPVIAGFISYYFKISFNKDSSVQSPEKLYRERLLMIFAAICIVCFVILLFTNIPILYDIFNVVQPKLSPLWVL